MKLFIKYIIAVYFALVFVVITADAKKIVVHSLEDFYIEKSNSGIKYVIKDCIDLNGSYLHLPYNSTLLFKKGCLVNGTIVGNYTSIKWRERKNYLRNCVISGSWNLDYACSDLFDSDVETLSLLRNLSLLSKHVKLSANREYHITAKGDSLWLETLESIDNKKPILLFHTTNPNINGLNLFGNNLVLKNLRIIDDYNPDNDEKYGINNLTTGNTIEIIASKEHVQSLKIIGCDFSGSTSSSYVASSQTKNCYVNNCSFSGYMADHAVYCSMKPIEFIVQDCVVNDIIRTTGLFKIRTSKDLQTYTLKGIKAHNLNGYLARLDLLETPKASILFDNIKVTKDPENNSVFYGFCITDETKRLEGENSYNAADIVLSNCYFGYGYKGESMIYPGSEKKVCVNTIKYLNVESSESNFGGGISNSLFVKNCSFKNFTDDQGIIIGARFVRIENSYLSRSNNDRGNNLFLINYTKNITNDFILKNVNFDVNVGSVFKVNSGEHLNVRIENSTLPIITKCLFCTTHDCSVEYIIRNSTPKNLSRYSEREYMD